jgi:hypothetical protein
MALPDDEKKPGFLRQIYLKTPAFPGNRPSEAGLLAPGTYMNIPG